MEGQHVASLPRCNSLSLYCSISKMGITRTARTTQAAAVLVASARPSAVPTVCAGSRRRPMTRSDRVATLEEAKAQFQKSWDAWKAWAKLEEAP
jgi:hypothetical protein